MSNNTPSTNSGNNNNVDIPTLIRLTQGMDNEARTKATSQLKFLEDTHFADYIFELCRILGTASADTQIRVGAGLLLKNCVGEGRSEQHLQRIRTRWLSLDIRQRNKLKDTILNILGVSDVKARDTCVNVISNLAMVETLSEWNNLIPTLIQKCLTKNKCLMYSSLKCIGQIGSNEITHSEIAQYTPKILECIAHGMSCAGSFEIQSESMKCLYEIIELIKNNISIEKERRIIYQMVLCGSNNQNNFNLRLNSFMTITQIIEHYYNLTNSCKFMQSVFQISKQCIENGINNYETIISGVKKETDIVKQAIEIWSTTAEIEYELQEQQQNNFGFVNKSLQLLVPIYLNALLKQKDEYDEDEWTIRKAAACSLELFALVAKDNILKYVLQFVEQNIGQNDWHNREAALCSFGCILDGPSAEKLGNLVSQILPPVLQLMGDKNIQVRTTATWTFGRICELIPSSVESSKPEDILSAIVRALHENNNIGNKACWSIASLTRQKHACIYNGNNAFNLIKELLKRGARNDSDNTLIIGTHEAINSIIYHFENENKIKPMLQSLLPELVQQMVNCVKIYSSNNNNSNTDKTEYKMAGLLSTVQVILDKLGNGCLDANITNTMMQCVLNFLQRDNNLVYEEALGLITHIARCIGNNFNVYLCSNDIQEILIKSIRLGLKGNIGICRIGVGVIGDVYTHCTDFIQSQPLKLQQYSDRIVSELLTILINNAIGIELKSHIVDALTDILIAHGTYAHRYSADILDKCLQIGCLVPPKNCHSDMLLIFNEIRCSIIDTTRSCLAELAQASKVNDFNKYVPKINAFFEAICKDINRIDDNVLKSCIKLLAEAADYCHGPTKQQLRTQWTQAILQKAGQNQQNRELAQEAQKAFKQISQN